MKLYLTEQAGFVGTQAEAKKAGPWKPEEVPTDKQGLIEYLNRHLEECRTSVQTAIEQSTPKAIGNPTQAGVDADRIDYTENRRRQWTSDDIVEFLQDHATQHQVERIFEAIGTRWGEARK